MTKHYMDRYFERVFGISKPNDLSNRQVELVISTDMDKRMNIRQKNNMEFISGSKSRAKIPMGKYTTVVDNDMALTIY
tara:strand:+ start:360 stop:593 length:234 start_codon:yes stop_codon:yes gene_type:complete